MPTRLNLTWWRFCKFWNCWNPKKGGWIG